MSQHTIASSNQPLPENNTESEICLTRISFLNAHKQVAFNTVEVGQNPFSGKKNHDGKTKLLSAFKMSNDGNLPSCISVGNVLIPCEFNYNLSDNLRVDYY